MEMVTWLKENADGVAATVLAFIALAETITRLTPTKDDDGFVHRVGKKIDLIFSLVGVPNVLKKPKVKDDLQSPPGQ